VRGESGKKILVFVRIMADNIGREFPFIIIIFTRKSLNILSFLGD
jgi:hypothetical protein